MLYSIYRVELKAKYKKLLIFNIVCQLKIIQCKKKSRHCFSFRHTWYGKQIFANSLYKNKILTKLAPNFVLRHRKFWS